MEPALDVINRALQGDPGSRSFLERTTTIYVLDVNDRANPKTYGCWNFIHQGMNEVERYEARYLHQATASSSSNGVHGSISGNGNNASSYSGDLVAHARMMAAMALRVARRSPSTDTTLVATCVLNAYSQYQGAEKDSKQLQWLVDLNLELREIVIGRIAAMAFDFSFHRVTGPNGSGSGSGSGQSSAFADRVVMDMFCAILSANAVATGPTAVKTFATEWIIPSSSKLPPFAVAAVVLHLANEGLLQPSAPAGTKDTLQQLSLLVMNTVLVPILANAVSGDDEGTGTTTRPREECAQVASMCLRAMKVWCDATDLSLAQIKHLCSKVEINVVDVLSDAMYSDSPQVIDSLAELMETIVPISDEKVMSAGRMSQVRHIIQVDESSFSAEFTPHQLKTIESHEMASIVDELVSAIGIQRFRFSERQNNGDYDVCRNLTRIAATICETWLDIAAQQEASRQPEAGVVTLLVKAAGHASFHICAIALPILTRIMPTVPSLSRELLPTLQRRAITPHHVEDGMIRLDASDICDVTFHEFQNFRTTVLCDAVLACWNGCRDHFMDSCTSAVEEFCASQQPNQVSLQLEAALFCMEQIAAVALIPPSNFTHTEQLKRVFGALSTKPPSLMINPLTREGMCRFVRKFTAWCADQNGLDVTIDLVVSSLLAAISPESSECLCADSQRDMWQSPVREASRTISSLLSRAPDHFANEACVIRLVDMWDAVYTSLDRNDEVLVHVDDRVCLCLGLDRILTSLSDEKRLAVLERVTLPPCRRLDRLVQVARHAQVAAQLSRLLIEVGAEIRVISALSRGLVCEKPDGANNAADDMEFELQQPSFRPYPELALNIMQRVWPSISLVADKWADDENVANGLGDFLSSLIPLSCEDENNLKLLRELCSLSTSILAQKHGTQKVHVTMVFGFICKLLATHGDVVERGTVSGVNGHTSRGNDSDVAKLVTDALLTVVSVIEQEIPSVRDASRNGQNGVETKEPTANASSMSDESLSAILTVLNQALVSCPIVLLHLSSASEGKPNVDKLFRQVISSAVSSLSGSVPELTRSSISFLMTLVQSQASPHERLRLFVAEAIAHLRRDIVSRLILAVCNGTLEYEMIGPAVELLSLLLAVPPQNQAPPGANGTSSSNEMESHLVATLRQDQFRLGDPARTVTLAILLRSASAVPLEQRLDMPTVTAFWQDVWQLHRMEDNDAIPGSDKVARFLVKYSF